MIFAEQFVYPFLSHFERSLIQYLYFGCFHLIKVRHFGEHGGAQTLHLLPVLGGQGSLQVLSQGSQGLRRRHGNAAHFVTAPVLLFFACLSRDFVGLHLVADCRCYDGTVIDSGTQLSRLVGTNQNALAAGQGHFYCVQTIDVIQPAVADKMHAPTG